MRLLREARALAQTECHDTSFASVMRAVVLDAYPIMVMTRIRETCRRFRIPAINRSLRFVQMTLYGVEIGKDVEFGEGVSFVHSLGTVVGGTSRIGNNVRFMGNNTIGTASDNGCPVIEDGVTVGCGARVLGPIRVGAGAIIGANSVVIHDVPAGAVVAGSPARVLRSAEERSKRQVT